MIINKHIFEHSHWFMQPKYSITPRKLFFSSFICLLAIMYISGPVAALLLGIGAAKYESGIIN